MVWNLSGIIFAEGTIDRRSVLKLLGVMLVGFLQV